MKRIIAFLFCIAVLSCKKDKSASGGTADTPNVKEIQPSKNYYGSLGALFQFRIAYAMGLSSDGGNNNYTTLDVYSIIERGGKVSVLFNTSIPGILQRAGAIIDCKGEYLSAGAAGGLNFNQGYAQKAEADILPNNELIMYIYERLARASFEGYGNIGNEGGYYHNVTKDVLQNAVTPNGSWGYMYILNNQPYYFSLWGTIYPALHTYNASTKTWSNQKVVAMDGTYKDFVVSHDVAKVGNDSRVYWAYLSFKTDFNTDGQLNILSFDGSAFSTPKSLTIGDIGEGSGGNQVYKHSVMLVKNGSNPQQPYIMVRRYNTDILDFYKYNGNTIEVVKQGVNMPNEILITSGSLRRYSNIVGVNGNIYMFATDGGSQLFKLSANKFEKVYDNILKSGERFTAIEASAKGLLVSVGKVIPAKPQKMEVCDIILIPN